jgi:hypothetical protein
MQQPYDEWVKLIIGCLASSEVEKRERLPISTMHKRYTMVENSISLSHNYQN